MEDEDPLWRVDDGMAPAICQVKSNFSLGISRHRRKMLAATGVAALVACAMLSVRASPGGQAMPTSRRGQGHERQIPTPQQKRIMIGSPQVPDGLPAPPQPEVMFIGHPSYHCVYPMASVCPAHELFWNAEVHEVVTENLMQVGRGLLVHADRDMVRSTVAAGFRNISLQISRRSPELAKAIFKLELNEEQKNLVVTYLRLMSIPDVQSIGFEVALAIRRSLTTDRMQVRQKIEEMLRSNLDEVKRLRDEHVSEQLLTLWGSEHQWEMTLDPENIRVMEAFHGGRFFGSMNASFYVTTQRGGVKKLPHEEKAYGAWGGILEEGRALLNIIRIIAHSSGSGEFKVPAWAASLGDNMDVQDLGRELLSCELYESDGMDNFMKALFCPLKYGVQGIDALRAVDQMLRHGEQATPAGGHPTRLGGLSETAVS